MNQGTSNKHKQQAAEGRAQPVVELWQNCGTT